ncbi:lipopolysaccharide export system permease protein [Rhodovulum iodosum]|uniref:Lipopolysaccharide export system permease protein n=1 Tax=Rhodovulum iodosum TaxID=68291 RepID=A0ABV3XV13_9RHOB|nr:LPS export ABC transporter permease LptF [Rhodovulum robiginosum]RSK33633.1 LPS export ABC transporter permease LptF [Rhodovulum robiginosum]
MPRFDRYLLSQLTVFFGFFSLVLVSIYWVNRAVALFETLIGGGQSAAVFLEFTALTLPNVIRLVLPVSGFAAVVYAVNRLTSESELVVMQAMGLGPFRLARPVVVFGLGVALLTSILTHVLVPASRAQLANRQAEIAENVTAGLLREGQFLHPADGITFYIREITPVGELRDVFLSDARPASQRTTYTARRALLVSGDTGPKLLMFDGMAQTLREGPGTLATTGFRDLSYDLSGLIEAGSPRRVDPRRLSTAELLSPTPAVLKATGESRAELLYEGHARTGQPLIAVSGALIGFAALMLGGFSRFGLWRQILLALMLLIGLQLMDNTVADFARKDPSHWPAVYLPAATGALIALVLLWISARPEHWRWLAPPRRKVAQ